jgi:hypothetical protein
VLGIVKETIMINTINWEHFKQITGRIDRIKANIKQLGINIDELKAKKEAIIDDPVLKAALKEIIDVYPGATMTSIVADYNKFIALKDWLEENEYI